MVPEGSAMPRRDDDLEDVYGDFHESHGESAKPHRGSHTGLIVVLVVSGAIMLALLVCGSLFRLAVFG
jgi:hypothetical protein